MSEKRRSDAKGTSTSIYEMLSKMNDSAFREALNVLIAEAEDDVAAKKEEEQEAQKLALEKKRKKKEKLKRGKEKLLAQAQT